MLGTTYRDLHAEREQLLKRTFPVLRREFAEQGVLLSLREIKWSHDAGVVASQVEEFVKLLTDDSTCYLGIRSSLQPQIPATISLDADIPLDLLAVMKQRIQAGTSWQKLEQVLLAELKVARQLIFDSDAADPSGLLASIETELRSLAAALERVTPASYHELYLAARSDVALESASRSQAILGAIADRSVVLVGDTGSGKSTSIALTLRHVEQEGKQAVPYVLDGADTSESSITSYLQQRLEGDRRDGAESVALPLLLSRSTDLVLAIDGIEYLDDRSRYLGWLPDPLPSGVRVIASTTLPSQAEALEARGWSVINTNVLSEDQLRALIDHLCVVRDLWLTESERAQIASHPLAFHHQFVITLFDELSQFGWYGQLHRNLDEHLDELSVYELYTSAAGSNASDSRLPHSLVRAVRLKNYLESHSLVELYQKVLERLEYDFGTPQLTRVLGYLAVTLHGLTIADLAAITAVPEQTVQHMVNALGENINAKGPRLSLGNEHFAKAVRSRYLGSNSVLIATRSALTLYLETQTEAIYVEELAAQLYQANDSEALRALLLNTEAIDKLLGSVPIALFAKWWKLAVASSAADVRELYQDQLASIEQLPLASRLAVLRHLAEFFLFIGDPAGSLDMLTAALSAIEETPTSEYDRGTILRALGRTYYLLARYKDAEQAYRGAIEVFNTLKTYPEESIAATHDLAKLLAEGAQFDAADELFTQLISEIEHRNGIDSPELAPVLNSIGIMLNAQGRYDAAITVAARARNIYATHWGREYPELGWCYHVFATAYRQKAEFEEAERWYEAAIERFTQMYGQEHPIPLRSMYGLAVLLQRKGDLPAAIEQGREVVALRTKLLGPGHADTAAAYVMLGGMLEAIGDYDEAVELLSRGLDIFDHGANKEHPEVARTLHELGEVYAHLGELAEARESLLRAYTIRSKVLGIDHQDTIASFNLLNSLPNSPSTEGSPAVIPAN